MICAGFHILFGLSFVFFSCEGQNVSPPSNKSIIVLPGSTARLKWTFVGDPSKATLSWYFTRRGGTNEEELAVKFRTTDAIIQNRSLPGVAIETPATLVLKNVDERYNGKYLLNVQVAGGGGEAEVEVFIAVTPTVTFSCSSPIIVNEGDDFTCVCRGEGGNPPADLTWYKDGIQIGGTGKEEQTLTLSNVNGTDSGTYKCLAQSHINATNEKSIEIVVKLNFKPKNTTITFTKNPAVVGGNVAVMCNSNGLPEPSYTIIHNDNKDGIKNSTYIIDDVKDSDAGTYKCIASNKLGNDSAPRSLTVGKIYLPPGGNSLTFLKEPTVKIKWSLDPVLSTNISRSWSFKSRASGKGEILGEVSRTGDITIITSLYEVDIEKPATLVLKNVDERYNGAYKFTLYPGLPGPSISEVVVFIAEKPDVRINCPRRITLDEGENRICVCTEQGGNPRANLTWYKDDQQIDKATYGKNRLPLTSVTKQDIGTYKCVAQSYTLTDEESIEVNVILNFKPENTKIVIEQQGKPVTVTCNSEGRPEPSYRITRDGTVVSTGKMYTIFEATLSGGGRFTCIAWNKLGNDSASAYLAVTDTSCGTEWYIVVVSVVSGIIIGILLSYIVTCSRRKFRSREPQSNPQAQTTEVDTTYQELDLTKMNKEENYQSLRVNAASNDAAANDDDSTYTQLSKTRDVEDNYQSLT